MPGAVAAAGALDRINVTGMFGESDGEISRLTFNGFYFTVCYQVDVQMPADLDQFG
jgi:hypothetical protein